MVSVMKSDCKIFIVPTKYGKGAFGYTENKEDYFYSICPEGKFVYWIEKIIKEHPYAKMRCVIDENITKWIESRKQQDDLFAKKIVLGIGRDK